MLDELLTFIHLNFEVDQEAGQVLEKATGRRLTATKFQTLPLTAKEVVWAHSQRALPIGIMLRDPDRLVRRFALDNLAQYDPEEEEAKLCRISFNLRLAWHYWPDAGPLLVELCEYGLRASIVRLSPINWRFQAGVPAVELNRLKRTKAELRRTNLKENSLWRISTERLVLVYGREVQEMGRWVKKLRHRQTFSHRQSLQICHEVADLQVRPRHQDTSSYKGRRLAELQQQSEARSAPFLTPPPHPIFSPLSQYAKENLFPSPARREFDQRMAKWICANTLGDSQFTP
jgi:hypothetical protein